MAQNEARIEQFKKMAEADPTNELGHFSLGKAYLDAQMPGPAIASFGRVLELNPKRCCRRTKRPRRLGD
jgi:tetratricopeptide (TPR) repeat protein